MTFVRKSSKSLSLQAWRLLVHDTGFLLDCIISITGFYQRNHNESNSSWQLEVPSSGIPYANEP